jgi:hypothetical protein
MVSPGGLQEHAGMRPLAGETVLAAWERGIAQAQPARAITLLLAGRPDLGEQDAAAISIPARDLALLRLRGRSFGSTLSGFSECPSCGDRLEFALPETAVAATLRSAADAEHKLEIERWVIRLRLANTADVAAAAALSDLDDARSMLLTRCTEVTDAEDAAVSFGALPENARDQALAHLQAMHEAAELTVALACPACGAKDTVALDLSGFLWAEVRHAARLLLEEVHELAWAYGWNEEAILAMSPPRRQAYLERLRA